MRAAQFLREELPVRLAHRVVELDTLPDGLSAMPSIQRVKGWYAQSFHELTALPRPRAMHPHHLHRTPGGPPRPHDDDEYDDEREQRDSSSSPAHARPPWPAQLDAANARFVQVLEAIKRRHDPVTSQIGPSAHGRPTREISTQWHSVRSPPWLCSVA
jgi:pyruvate dehydrogenase kinase 2/3/4